MCACLSFSIHTELAEVRWQHSHPRCPACSSAACLRAVMLTSGLQPATTRRRADRVHKAILSGRRATVMQSSAHLSIDPVEAQEFDPFLRSAHGSAQSHAANPRRQLSAVRFWTVRRSSATADAHDRCLTLGCVEHPSRTRGARPRLDAGVHRSCVRIQDFSGRCSHCRHSRLVVECQQLSRLRSSPASASVHADRWQSSRL